MKAKIKVSAPLLRGATASSSRVPGDARGKSAPQQKLEEVVERCSKEHGVVVEQRDKMLSHVQDKIYPAGEPAGSIQDTKQACPVPNCPRFIVDSRLPTCTPHWLRVRTDTKIGLQWALKRGDLSDFQDHWKACIWQCEDAEKADALHAKEAKEKARAAVVPAAVGGVKVRRKA